MSSSPASVLPAAQPTVQRIHAVHPGSGNVLSGEVLRVVGEAPARSVQFIPDGLLEAVIVREGVWQLTELPPTGDA